MSIRATTLSENYAPLPNEDTYGVNGAIELPVLLVPEKDPSWREQALCSRQDINMFFSTHGWRAAIQVCDVCVVKGRCLEFAVENEIEHGVWGGLTAKQRKEIK